MKLKGSLIQTQKPVLAQVLQQSISVLMLSSAELTAAIEQELQANPLLEGELTSSRPKDMPISEIRKSLDHLQDAPYQSNFTAEGEDDQIPIPQLESFEEHLLTQLRIEVTDPLEQKIGELIIGNLNSDGFLTASLEEIAQSAGASQAAVEKVLKEIQHFDPVGTAARNIEECLIVQLSASDSPLRDDAVKVVQHHLKDLCHKRYESIAQKTGLTAERVKEASQLIATLEPKPARNYQTFDQNIYVQPDIFVLRNLNGGFRIEINRKEVPLIRINPMYHKLLKSKTISEQERQFIQEKLTSAINFIKSIQQRGETILNIAEYILQHQRAFFEEGEASSLLPMTLKDIAQNLGRNESTISRAIHNKYMDTPQGIFALKFFFSQAVNESNKDVSSHNIKEEIRKMVEEEDKSAPLSDSDIQNSFASKGIKLARRTINKYRQELDIPPSHLRKE